MHFLDPLGLGIQSARAGALVALIALHLAGTWATKGMDRHEFWMPPTSRNTSLSLTYNTMQPRLLGRG